MSSEDQLVFATYGLVIATALLVIATAIPVVQRWAEQRSAAEGRAGRVVPDMNILHSRLEGYVTRHANRTTMDPEITSGGVDRDLAIVARIVEYSYSVGLEFANEMYLVRHFLTQARIEIRAAEREAASDDDGRYDRIRTALAAACANYKAADTTLGIAESLLPKKGRLIKGQTFWGRFERLSKERTLQAEKDLVDIRASLPEA